jgi:uncharacterized delta-60 repeat protein
METLARFDGSGTPDASFGTGGRVVSSLANLHAIAVGLQPNGSIVTLAVDGDIKVARFTSTGSLDGSFGTGGVVTTDCGGNEQGGDLVVRPDGTIVVATSNDSAGCVVQYRPDGTLDPAFAGGAPLLLPDWTIGAAALQSNGTLLIAGNVAVPASRFAVGRVGVDGKFLGATTLDLPPYQLAVDVVTAANGDAIAVSPNFDVVRLKPNGSPSSAFGTGGIATLGVTGMADRYDSLAVAVQPDGKIVVGGAAVTEGGPPLGDFSYVVLARTDPSGALDPSYGTGGVVESGSQILISALRVQPDGKAVETGTSVTFPGGSTWGIARHIGFSTTCPQMPASGCKTAIAPLAGTLKIGATADPKKTKEQWSWQKGADTTLVDFGDPIGGDTTLLCTYDESGMTPVLTSYAVLSGGSVCKGKPCWRVKGTTGLSYTDPTRAAFGIGSVKLAAGTGGAAKIQVKAQGAAATPPALPLALPTRVQLITENGACFESVFSATGQSRSDPTHFAGKSD